MNSKRSSLSGLTLRLLVTGIPTYAINPFAELLVKWTTCSGEEWTVSRCKALKLSIIQLRSGHPITTPLARNRKGDIKGVVGSLMRFALKSDKNFIKVLNAFMAYSHWTSSHMTRRQKEKFLKAVNANPVVIQDSLRCSLARVTKAVVGTHAIHGKPQPLLFWRGSPNKRAPTESFGSVPQSEQILTECELLRNGKTLEHVIDHWHEIYSHVFEGINIDGYKVPSRLNTLSHRIHAGEVHFLQEPGYKMRSIASPYRLFQVASEPLKNTLGSLVRSLPWDCTHGQDRAFPFVQEKLRNSEEVYCVDLSSATDYFPFELQKIVLETIFGKDNSYIHLFEDISSAYWTSELGIVRWKRGQPLGFNPSFFSFTLTHGLLLQTLLGRRWNHEFFVVGDDVVILNRKLFLDYMSTLDALGCPYAPEKTIVSSKLAEFAGKVILPDIVLPQLKWRKVSDENFLDLARFVGRRIRLLLTKKQNKVIDTFSGIPDFVHPYGLNWSFPGSNLEVMIHRGLELCFKERVLDSLTGLGHQVHCQLYADYESMTYSLINRVDETFVKETIQTFDEKVKSVFLRSGFARKQFEYFLEGLKDIPLALCNESNHCELPLENKPPSRVTLLQRLSRYRIGNLNQE